MKKISSYFTKIVVCMTALMVNAGVAANETAISGIPFSFSKEKEGLVIESCLKVDLCGREVIKIDHILNMLKYRRSVNNEYLSGKINIQSLLGSDYGHASFQKKPETGEMIYVLFLAGEPFSVVSSSEIVSDEFQSRAKKLVELENILIDELISIIENNENDFILKPSQMGLLERVAKVAV